MFEIIKQKGGYLKVKVVPGAAENRIMEKMGDDTIKIAIKAVPEKGKANKELIKFLTKELDVSREQITIVSGMTDRIKLIKVSLSSQT